MAKINDPNAPRIARCSFCGKPQDQVRRLIAGNDAYICNECAELCQEIIREDFYSQDSFGTVKSVPKPTETLKAEEPVTMDELIVPDLGYDDVEPEMPSIEPISLDDAFMVEPAPESTMPSIEEEMAKRAEEAKQLEEEKKEITNFSKNMEEEIMSPQEKMRMFAQEQIEQNNKKIDELQLGIADKENKSIELGKQADEIYSQIIALQEKAKGFSSEKEKLDIEISQVKGDIEGLKRENEEFKSYIK